MHRRWISQCIACALTLCISSAQAESPSPLLVAPFVQDVQSDRFTIVFDSAQPVAATVECNGHSWPAGGKHHVVRVTGLTPGARVPYTVLVDGKSVGGGAVGLPDARRSLSFLVYGDTRDSEISDRLIALARSLSPDLILHTGDFVPHGDSVQSWYNFFREEAPLMADVPLYPALGNHELFRDHEAAGFRRFFVLPEPDRDRFYYGFRFGPAEFLVLDGNHPDAAQTTWLRQRLERARKEGVAHVFVLLHQPPLSVGPHCGEALAQADWVALFERYRVRAVFAGHDHAYERLERNGVRYFVSGGGGAPLYEESSCAVFDRAARRVYLPLFHLLRVRVNGADVVVEALPLDGSAPVDVVRFAGGEPMFAEDAPRLRQEPSRARWMIAATVAALLLGGFFVRGRRRRAR